jgi:RsiW-degrading membrane proteinase PrsW (M82 family)
VAIVPAVVWVSLFLKYHAERLPVVLLMFFAGMLSTAPILFYDTLVRRGVELQFFLFTVTPKSFSGSAQAFVAEHLTVDRGVPFAVATSLVTFAFVALIEEASKYWVLTRNARRSFRSIDDVMQLSIVVAIGFSFAENVVNPVYFTTFVRQYLFHGASPDVWGFAGNVLGRSVLTTMVHVLSTGVMGYFFGLAFFAGPYLKERHAQGHAYRLTRWLHALMRVPETSVFRANMLATGFILAVVLHGMFNFIVTVPEMLPGNPDTLGELIGPSSPGFLSNIPFLMVPSLLYVVGGFWLLTMLFLRKENMAELGHFDDPQPGEETAA